MPEMVRTWQKRARCSFQHIPLSDHHDGGYHTDQHWYLFCCPFAPAFPGICLERVFPKNPRSLEVPKSEPWHQQFLTMAIFKLKLRRMEVFKHLLAIHLPHSLHSRLSSKQRAGMSKKTAARYQQKKSKTSTEVRITK